MVSEPGEYTEMVIELPLEAPEVPELSELLDDDNSDE